MSWQSVNWLDLSILLVALTAALAGLLTGLLREIVSIASLSLSVAVTSWGYRGVASVLEGWTRRPDIAGIAAFVGLLVVAWTIVGTAGFLLSSAIPGKGPGLRSRLFGALLGLAKGLGLASIVLMVLTVYLPRDTVALRGSKVYPVAIEASRLFAGILPLEERLILLRRLDKEPLPPRPSGPPVGAGYVMGERRRGAEAVA